MRKHSSICWFITVCSSVCIGYELTRWHMGSVCGITIARGLSAGELIFRADDFLSGSGDTCIVVINPNDKSGIRERTVLYFTEFKMDTSCGDNVTVVNGDMSDEWRGNPSATDVVTGLPMQLCGHNKSLEESEARFFTVDNTFTVIYHRTDSLPGNDEIFVMKFASYHEGKCNTDRYYKCSNGHCISKDLRCHGDIEACGEKDSNCLNSGETEAITFFDRLKDILTPLFITGVGFVLLLYIFKECKSRHGSVRNFPIIRDFLSCTQNPRRRPRISESVSLTPSRDDDVQATVDGETELPVDQSISSAASFPDNNVTPSVNDATTISPPEYDTLSTTSEFQSPPSYDQVMSNKDVYSYNDQN